MMEVLLETKNLKKHFPVKRKLFEKGPVKTVKAVDGVSLKIYKGEALGLIGESGCGKSTLSRVILKLIPATEGEVLFHGEPVTGKNLMKFRQQVQMVFQDPYSSLDPRMSVRRIIEEPLRVQVGSFLLKKAAAAQLCKILPAGFQAAGPQHGQRPVRPGVRPLIRIVRSAL